MPKNAESRSPSLPLSAPLSLSSASMINDVTFGSVPPKLTYLNGHGFAALGLSITIVPPKQPEILTSTIPPIVDPAILANDLEIVYDLVKLQTNLNDASSSLNVMLLLAVILVSLALRLLFAVAAPAIMARLSIAGMTGLHLRMNAPLVRRHMLRRSLWIIDASMP